MLKDLKQLGLVVVEVSNAFLRTGAGYRRDFEQLGISDLIDHVLSSVDTGVRKPSLAMFRLALRASTCGPAQTVMIGDSEEKDILPAKRLGMRTIRIALAGRPSQPSAANAVVTRLADASAVVVRWVVEDRDR